MSTENIDVVINPGQGARRVVRDLNDIASAADTAGTRIANLQRQINGLGTNTGLSQFQSQLTAVNTQLQQMNQQLQQMQGGFGRLGGNTSGIGSLTGAISSLMGALSVKKLMDWTDAWISAEGKIRTLAPTLAAASAVMEQLFAIAQETRAPIDKLAQLYHLMTISAKDLGTSQTDMLRVTETVSKVMAVQGTNATQARGALLQLAQSFGTGRVRAQEFNSLMQGMPLLLKLVSQHIDGAQGSTARLRTMMINGKLSSKEFFDALLASSVEADALFAQAPKTFAQGWTVLQNAVEKYLGKLNESNGISATFSGVMETLAKNIDTVAGSLFVVAGVLLALPFGPVAVAITAATLAMMNFGQKALAAHDNVTTIADVGAVVWEDFRNGLDSVQKKMQQFGSKEIPGIGKSLQDLGNVTFMDLVRLMDIGFDKILQAAVGGAFGIKAAFQGLPAAVDEVGKMMFNALVGWIESALNKIIEGINKVASFTGQSIISAVSFTRAKTDDTALKRYGQSISEAVAAGMTAAGNPFEKSFNSLMDRARVRASARLQDDFRKGEINGRNAQLDARGPATAVDGKPDLKALREDARNQMRGLQEIFDQYKEQAAQITEVERHKEAMLKSYYDGGVLNYKDYMTTLQQMQDQSFQDQVTALNQTKDQLEKQFNVTFAALQKKGAKPQELDNFTKDFQTKVATLNDLLDKLRNKQDETLAGRTAAVAKPLADFNQNMEKTIALDDVNLKQELQKVDAKKNVNELDERNLFIQQELLRLMNPYEDALQKVNSEIAKAKTQGLFDSDSEVVQKQLLDMVNLAAKLETKLNEIKKTAPETLGDAFDAGKVGSFSKEFSSGIAEALVTGGKDGAKKLRTVLQDELFKKPFQMILQALLQPLGNMIGQLVVGGVKSITNSLGNSLTGNNSGVNADGSVNLGGMGSGLFGGNGAFEDTVFNAGSTLNQNGFEEAGNFLMDNSGTVSDVASGIGYVGAAFDAAKGKWGAAVGSAIGTYFGGPIGSFIGSAIGGALQQAIDPRGGPKQGGYIGAAPAAGVNAIGVQDTPNQQIITDLISRVRDFNRTIDSTIQSMGGQSLGFRLGLGVSTDPQGKSPSFVESNLRDAQGNLVSSNQNINVGRTPEELAAELTKQTTNAMIAALDHSGIDAAYMEFFHRIADNLDDQGKQDILGVVVGVAQLTKSLSDMGNVFSNVVNLSVDAKVALISFAGGLDKLQQGMTAYFDNFFSDSEKRVAIATGIANTLNRSGFAGGNLSTDQVLNASRATFRSIVESLDLTTVSGQQMYAAFMSVAGAFAQLTQSADSAANAVNQLDKERSALTQGYQDEKSTITQTIDSLKQWISSMVTFRQGLQQGSNSPLTPTEKYEAAKVSYNDVLQKMSSSDPTVADDAKSRFESVAKDFLDSSKVVNASSSQYQQDFAKVMADSLNSQNDASSQMSFQQQQLTLLDQSVQNLLNINTSVISVRDAIHALEGTRGASLNPAGTVAQIFNETSGRPATAAEMAGPLVPYVNMIANGDLSINELRATAYGSGVYLQNHTPEQAVRALATSMLGRQLGPSDQSGVQAAVAALAQGASMIDIAHAIQNLPEMQGAVPGHAGGLHFVPEDNYMFRAHYGEAVLTKPEADVFRHVGLGGADMGAVADGLAAVHQELTTLRKQSAQATRAEMASNEMALERNAQKVGQHVSESANRQSFKDRARARHRIA